VFWKRGTSSGTWVCEKAKGLSWCSDKWAAWQVSAEEHPEVMVTVGKLVWVALTQRDPRGSDHFPQRRTVPFT